MSFTLDSQTPRFFVYGTLKRKQCRASLWPCVPVRVESARVRGILFDLGSYPAMRAGDDWVAGEMWEIRPADLTETLAVLDEIEGYAGAASDLYVRVETECELASGQTLNAQTYHYASSIDESLRIYPDASGHVRWPVD